MLDVFKRKTIRTQLPSMTGYTVETTYDWLERIKPIIFEKATAEQAFKIGFWIVDGYTRVDKINEILEEVSKND